MRTPTTVLAERYIIQYTCPLNTGERTIWFKQFSLFCNLLDESSSDTVFLELYERTADLTGTSRATVERIKQATDKGDAPRIPVKKQPAGTASLVHRRIKKYSQVCKMRLTAQKRREKIVCIFC